MLRKIKIKQFYAGIRILQKIPSLRRKNKNDKIIFGLLGKVKKLEGFDIGRDLKGLIVKIKSVNFKSFALRREMEGEDWIDYG